MKKKKNTIYIKYFKYIILLIILNLENMINVLIKKKIVSIFLKNIV